MLSNSAYALVAPFLPIELEKKGVPLSLFGYIFSIYSVAVIIGSPLIGYLLTKYKKRNLVRIGLFSMSMAMFGFVIAAQFKSRLAFIVIAFLTRFIQGFASCSIQTTCFSISGVLFSDN